ncbi:hypothetical protein BOTBODRAFT_131688, partial [Botryobasidium botryosum FD-172 SS1]
MEINVRNQNGETPLHIAARASSIVMIRFLLDVGADPHAQDARNRTPLAWATSPNPLKTLLRRGTDINQRDEYGRSALHLICYNRYLHECDTGILQSLIRTYLDFGGDVDAVDKRGRTPLHNVRFERNVVLVSGMLVLAGANLDARDNDGTTPIHLAARSGSSLMVEHLLHLRANVAALDKQGGSFLHYAACSPYSFPALFGMAAAAGLDLNKRDSLGLSPIHWGARGPHNWDNIRALLQAGADVNARDNRGWTPLHHASRFGTPFISKKVLAIGADPEAPDLQGDSPLAA